ncbi:hypothetical protein JCM18902_2408 [Psychrobacter sp. JCM 18902]|nr:hypothetical protein JCM18902_2408 [Psychrobacter sp. JCM 18902]
MRRGRSIVSGIWLVRGLLSGCVVMNTSKWLKRQIITYLCQLANDHERSAL